jgi:hypothetical protein
VIKQTVRKFTENEIELVLLKFPDGATPKMILKEFGLEWDMLTRKESQSFTSALNRLYRTRKAFSYHVYAKFVRDNQLPYEMSEGAHHTRIIFHRQFEDRFNDLVQKYNEWIAKQPLPTKPYSIGRKYGERALETVKSEPTTYQPRAVEEAKVTTPREPTVEEQKAVLFAMYDNKCFSPATGAYPMEIAKWAKISDEQVVLKILQKGSQALEESDKVFDQDIQRRTWFLSVRGKQRVAEIRFGAIEFMLDESIAGICLNKWNRKAIHFLVPGKTVEEIAMTIGYVWDDSLVLPDVARRYCIEEINRMIKTLKRYEVLTVEEHELMPGMTKISSIKKPDILKLLRYLSLCIEHLHTLFVENENTESILRSLVPPDKLSELKDQVNVKSLEDLLSTGFFASPSPLQLVGKYIPDLTAPDPAAIQKMVVDFNRIVGKPLGNTSYIVKQVGAQYWVLNRKKSH